MNVLTRAVKLNKLFAINTFYQSRRLLYDEDEYPKVYDRLPEKKKWNILQQAKNGYFGLKKECNLYINETKNKFNEDEERFNIEEEEVKVIWRFNGTSSCLDPWLTVCDSDYNEGFSTCKLELTSEGKAIFSGNLDYRIPKDGIIASAGYCTLRTTRFRKSFARNTNLNWTAYTHLVMRVKGDGRVYMINIGNKGLFAEHQYALYNYVLFTRGGPYWQFIRIPFSKFFLSSKGRVQDKQERIDLTRISSFGIIASDQIPGPFKLEIDYIGLLWDPAETEDFAYEMYDINNVFF